MISDFIQILEDSEAFEAEAPLQVGCRRLSRNITKPLTVEKNGRAKKVGECCLFVGVRLS